jgi:hypothetical protein
MPKYGLTFSVEVEMDLPGAATNAELEMAGESMCGDLSALFAKLKEATGGRVIGVVTLESVETL